MPRLDGAGWPERRAVGGSTFEQSALYEMGYREAFEPAAHEIADTLMTQLLPSIPLGSVAPDDAPYLGRILMVAAQVGAGVGLVEARNLAPGEGLSDCRIWAVLWRALTDLPKVPAPQRIAAAYLMQAGYFIARTSEDRIPELLIVLKAQ